MPSPFRGMDPYLEERSVWPGMHQRLITYMAEFLQPEVEPKYVACIGERVEITTAPTGYVPDVMIVEPSSKPAKAQVPISTLVADEPQIVSYLDEERTVPYLEIVYRETGDVVTLIEILSPDNKVGAERKKYLEKQANILATHTNLVEIDLLSYGRDTTLARNVPIANPADWRYMISISRASRRNRLELYPLPLKERLPRCRIPLRAADPDVVLDLPTIFNRCYDVGRYKMLIDYTKKPSVTLTDAEAKWTDALLKEAGLR